MKYIKTDNANDRLMYINNFPFDTKHGLGKTEEELLQDGFLVEDIPKPEQIEGKSATTYYTTEQGFWFEYADIPKTPEQIQAEKIDQLNTDMNSAIMELTMLIAMGGM
jgi:hypothetical protein